MVTTAGSSVQLLCVIEPGNLVLNTAYWTLNNGKIKNTTVQLSINICNHLIFLNTKPKAKSSMEMYLLKFELNSVFKNNQKNNSGDNYKSE